jgi:hypothetical protein
MISDEDQAFIEDGLRTTGRTGGGGGGQPQCSSDINCPTNYICVNRTCVQATTPIPAGVCQVNGDCRTGYICDISNPTFPTGDLTDPYGVCRQESTGPVYCNATDQATQCATLLDNTWEGEATRTVNVLVNGKPTPDNCVNFPGIPTEWDTSECRKIIVVTPTPTSTPTPTPTPTPTATPSPTTYTTTLVASPPEGGTVEGTSALTPNPSTTITSRIGERVSFVAEASEGYTFTGWYLNDRLWSSNYSPAILSSTSDTYVARFTQNPTQDICRCYFVAPTAPGESFDITFRECTANSIRQTRTINRFTNICSADIPAAGRNAQVPQDLGSNCSNTQSCIAPPDPTPTPTPTPTSILEPDPTPDPAPVPESKWRDCISGNLIVGTPPRAYREILYTGAGGGTCWQEVSAVVGFSPSLSEALVFLYQRGSANIPQPKSITVSNPSQTVAYRITLTTNADIKLGIGNKVGAGILSFTVEPRSNVIFSVNITPQLLEKLADGTSDLDMKVETQPV